jgi:hypothetical protein
MEEFSNRVNVWDKCDEAQQSQSLSLALSRSLQPSLYNKYFLTEHENVLATPGIWQQWINDEI